MFLAGPGIQDPKEGNWETYPQCLPVQRAELAGSGGEIVYQPQRSRHAPP